MLEGHGDRGLRCGWHLAPGRLPADGGPAIQGALGPAERGLGPDPLAVGLAAAADLHRGLEGDHLLEAYGDSRGDRELLLAASLPHFRSFRPEPRPYPSPPLRHGADPGRTS